LLLLILCIVHFDDFCCWVKLIVQLKVVVVEVVAFGYTSSS